MQIIAGMDEMFVGLVGSRDLDLLTKSLKPLSRFHNLIYPAFHGELKQLLILKLGLFSRGFRVGKFPAQTESSFPIAALETFSSKLEFWKFDGHSERTPFCMFRKLPHLRGGPRYFAQLYFKTALPFR